MLKGLVMLGLVALASCSRSDASHQQPTVTVSPSSAVQVVTPPPVLGAVQPPPQPAREHVADLVFDGEQLATCDEFDGTPEAIAKLLEKVKAEEAKAKASGKPTEAADVIRQGQTCAQATSNKPHQTTCTRVLKADVMTMTTYYYQAKLVTGSDAAMRECLKRGGSWERNDTLDAQREAAEQNVAHARRSLKRLGVD